MRSQLAALGAAVLLGSVAPARGQVPTRPRVPARALDHVRLMINAGEQASSIMLNDTQTFQQYQEQGTFTLGRTIGKRPFYDGGVAFHIVSGLHAGVSFSFFKDTGSGAVTAQVPHPFFFNQLRTTSGAASGVDRKETAVHIQVSWTERAAGGIEFTAFGGPSIFQTEQGLATKLNLTLANEVYPYDTLSFPGVTTQTVKDNVNGYNAGADMTWKLGKTFGLGALIRYSHGQKNFTPTGGQVVKIEAGGLHAGGGLRVVF
jgi:hypothetical protein